MLKRYRHWLGEEARHMVETFDGEYVLQEDHLAALEEKDKEIEQLEAENDNMRKIFDGLMDELQTWTTSRWSALQETKDERCGKCGRMFWHHIKAKMNLEE